MGMLPGPDREKLFTKDLAGLTLAKAMEFAENALRARVAAAAATGAGSGGAQAAPHALFKITRAEAPASAGSAKRELVSSAGKVQCQVCGYYNHETSQCRFTKAKCRKCNVTGHLRRMCTKIKYVESGAVEESDDDVFAK
nr:uncharacterized protein LOC126055917 [Helicoverpa armigera]